ncbi:glycosyltransferase [Candidatus Microgenomates bacterium]|nr:MAG: glycosyltransferase [Candidatus Microgenomates bacterium]
MKIGVFLAIGESWEDFTAKGQANLFLNDKLVPFAKTFASVYVFSYKNEQVIFPYKNIHLIPNKWHLNRYFYALLLPLLHFQYVRRCAILRGMQITGAIPGIVSKYLFRKKIVINYGYNYAQIAAIEGKLIQSLLFRLVKNVLLPLVDAIIVTNPSLLTQIKHLNQKVTLIPNSVDTTLFKPNKSVKKNQIIFIGRLESQKNLFMLIDSVSLIKKGQPALLFIGKGMFKQMLIKHAVKKRVRLRVIDTVTHDLLPNYIRQSLIFVLPSLLEGHPKALIEAMSCGASVIGTNVEGIRDVITDGHDGLLSELNPTALARQIQVLLKQSKLRSKLGSHARNTVLKKYDRKKNVGLEIRTLKLVARYA